MRASTKWAASRGVVSLVTFFTRVKKVTGMPGHPGEVGFFAGLTGGFDFNLPLSLPLSPKVRGSGGAVPREVDFVGMGKHSLPLPLL